MNLDLLVMPSTGLLGDLPSWLQIYMGTYFIRGGKMQSDISKSRADPNTPLKTNIIKPVGQGTYLDRIL